MNRTKLLTTCAITILFFTACNRSGKTGLLIPKDASIVVHVHNASLLSKLSWDEIKGTSWFKNLYKDIDDKVAKQVLDDPKSSGINLRADLAFFMKQQGSKGYVVFEGDIDDAAAFETFNKKVNPSAEKKQNGNTFSFSLNTGTTVSWNKSKFAYVMDASNASANPFTAGAPQMDKNFSTDSLRMFGERTLALESKELLDEDSRFTQLIKSDGDVHFWMNSGEFYSNAAFGMLSLMKLNVLFEGNISTSTLNFEDGKISLRNKNYYGREVSKVLEKYDAKPVTEALINRIPSQNIVGMFAANFPPEGLKDILKLAGLDGVINAFLGKMNYSMEEFILANKGDVLFAVSDFKMKNEPVNIANGDGQPYASEKPDMNVLFSLSVKNKDAFNKLITLAAGSLGGADTIPGISYSVKNDWFAVGNNPEKVSQFLSGASSGKSAYASKITGHPFGGYVDIQKILTTLQPTIKDTTSIATMNASVKLWKDVVFTGGDYKDGAMTSEMEISLVDQKTNSLKQFNQYIDFLANEYKANKSKLEELLPPAADTRIDTSGIIIDTTTAK